MEPTGQRAYRVLRQSFFPSSERIVANGEASPEPDHDEPAGGPNFPIAGDSPERRSAILKTHGR
jgi:hypothetical protein